MAIRAVDPIQGLESLRAAVATATTSRRSNRPPAGSAQAQVAAAPAANDSGASTQAVEEVKQASESQMRFHVDQDTGKTVVALVNPESGEVLRQIPTAEALEVAKAIGKFQGMFVNLKV